MATQEDQRPDPDALLHALQREEHLERKAKLKIFFGMCAGVGKTYDMLKAAHEVVGAGVDLVVGYIETHKRPETDALLQGLSLIPRKVVDYKGTRLEEMDIDAILARKPRLVLVDELAHTNAPGSRHTKRYMDVQEILDNGIDVWTTLNVQHLESRADTVAQITGSIVRETVPDSILELADEVELIDIPADELLKRLAEGKVYPPERSKQAIENFFRKGNLTALREMSLRITAERVDRQLRDYMQTKRIAGPWKSSQRLIVGVSGSPHSASLIRWARNMAYSLNATWVAVHVETSQRLREEVRKQLARNIKLARDLGAEVVSTSDEDVAGAIIRVARRENCTQVLIGKSREGAFLRPHKFLRTILQESGDLDVHIIGGEPEQEGTKRRFALPEIHSGIIQYLVSAVSVLVVSMICFPLSHLIGYQTVSLILLFTVAVLPLMLGIGPVLLAAGLSALAWDYMFIPPIFTFSVARVEDVMMLFMYFCIAIVTGVLTTRARAQEKAVRQREERAIALYSLSRDLAVARTKDAVVTAAVTNIGKFFDAEAVVCLGQTDGDIFTAPHPESSLKIDAKDFAVAAWVYWNEKKAGKFTETLPAASATFFPISGPRYPLGVLGVKTRTDQTLSIDQETLLESFISQIASAVERETLNEITKRAIVVEESERLYKTLFNSISHEMRTPLSAIIGASESLLDPRVSQEAIVREELTEEIHAAAERLNRLVENLLDMTRLESGLVQPKLDWCDVRDLIHTAVRKLEKELSRHVVSVEVEAGMPLVRMDFALMEQAITNLLLNASMYTPHGSEIEVSARREDDTCVIVVADNGPGVPPGMEEKIFEKFYRVPGSTAGGTGLGLSIARGFVQAHKGGLIAERRGKGGTQFTIRIPVGAMEPDYPKEEKWLVAPPSL
jgi:two-component system sensor histidine kinase KdpD